MEENKEMIVNNIGIEKYEEEYDLLTKMKD